MQYRDGNGDPLRSPYCVAINTMMKIWLPVRSFRCYRPTIFVLRPPPFCANKTRTHCSYIPHILASYTYPCLLSEISTKTNNNDTFQWNSSIFFCVLLIPPSWQINNVHKVMNATFEKWHTENSTNKCSDSFNTSNRAICCSKSKFHSAIVLRTFFCKLN